MQQKVLVFRNRTRTDGVVRPSNWAERLAGNAASFEQGRMVLDPGVQHCAACPGYICLRVDQALEMVRPEVVEDIRSFMNLNDIPEYSGCPQSKDDTAPIAA